MFCLAIEVMKGNDESIGFEAANLDDVQSPSALFKYLEKLPTRKTAHMVFGNCVHTALEHYNHHGDVELAVTMFKDLWDDPSKIGLEIQVWPGRMSAGSFREKGIKLIYGFHSRAIREGRRVIATEHPFLVPIGDHEIVGYVDCLEVRKSGRGKNVLRIVDYKCLTPTVPVTMADATVKSAGMFGGRLGCCSEGWRFKGEPCGGQGRQRHQTVC